jgi:hypothetical protein
MPEIEVSATSARHSSTTTRMRMRRPSMNLLRRSHSQGREAGRPAGAGADQVRTGDQPQDRQGAQADRSGKAVGHRRWDDSAVVSGMVMVATSVTPRPSIQHLPDCCAASSFLAASLMTQFAVSAVRGHCVSLTPESRGGSQIGRGHCRRPALRGPRWWREGKVGGLAPSRPEPLQDTFSRPLQ